MRNFSLIASFAAFALAALGAVGAATFMVDRIEHGSERAVESLFLQHRLDWASVEMDGLQVRLTGTAPDEATRFEALTLAGEVVDATHVIDAMEVVPPKPVEPPDFSIEMLRNDEGISLIGLVPKALDRREMTELLQNIAGPGEVTDLLESADYPVPDGWAPALNFALDALADLPRSKISVAPHEVRVTAISDSAEQKRDWEAAMRQAVPDGVEVSLDISAPRPVITPFTLRFLLDEEGGRFDACSAHTEDGRARILAAAAEAGLQGQTECRLGLGVPSPRWPDAVTDSIRALSRLGGGTLTVSDADVTLVAPEGTAQRRFDTVVGELEAALPDVFSLHAVRPEPPAEDTADGDDPEGPPEFIATLSPEGLLQLRGRVSDERLRAAVEGFALARFSSAEVSAAMRVTEGLPAGWPGRVFAGLQSLSKLSNGALVVQPDLVEIRGDTGLPDAKAEIARILGEQLGAAGNFTIDVTYHEAETAPEEEAPTAEECVAAINAILSVRQITFDPGSADIEGAARISVDRIAEVMEDCTDVPMEIGGHTDSQGREQMNLGLSQRRAEAVLEALMARRVLVANLSAKGYGEAQPIADNDTAEGREANRRIEFTLIEPEAEEDGDGEGEGNGDEAPEGDGADSEAETDE
ncbi:OmpA family protein [Psychromarinibacter sp. C21-152]|uniref:OmpA family protein n=1 Tax=Psychromarinibacter sediminicola TaxID=3033385 RepID=A0AAE3TB29_9RHOB|nr:OmpA family protein [Psychromarinibacter sediminicola]MDF0602604.1 OmpA family protein [Psychromarinibacter sediminicola]